MGDKSACGEGRLTSTVEWRDDPPLHPTSLRRLRRRLVLLLVVYFFAGTASQKLIPGVDEIFPFFGWSLFSKVPGESATYTLVIEEQDGRRLEPAVSFLQAPRSLVVGNRFVGRKLIQRLGEAHDEGKVAKVERLRRLLERNYLRGRVRYRLVFERYQPLARWRSGESLERRQLGLFTSGEAE